MEQRKRGRPKRAYESVPTNFRVDAGLGAMLDELSVIFGGDVKAIEASVWTAAALNGLIAPQQEGQCGNERV
jgi:hypothetical protein